MTKVFNVQNDSLGAMALGAVGQATEALEPQALVGAQDDTLDAVVTTSGCLETATETADVIPFDRLPGSRFAAPRMSVYNTKRAQNARALAEQQDPAGIDSARNVLFEAGLRRYATDVADTADHNVMTLASALRLAALGFHVIDSHAINPKTGEGTEAPDRDTGKRPSHGKSPRGSQWGQRCSTNAEEVISFWTGDGEYPPTDGGDVYSFAKIKEPRNVSICFPAGCLMMAVDCDGDEGKVSIAALESKYGPLPDTVMQITGSGNGWHKFYRVRKSVYNSASNIPDAPKVDIRGEGGQVIVAPSVHKTGGYYTWIDDCEPWDIAEIPYLPEAWEELIHANSKVDGAPKTRKAAAKKAKASKDPNAKPAEKKVRRSYEAWLEFIGDEVGCGGYHGPIFGAARNYFVEFGNNADQAELLRDLKARIAVAARDPDKDRSKYGSERKLLEYITDAYDSAVRWPSDTDDGGTIDAEEADDEQEPATDDSTERHAERQKALATDFVGRAQEFNKDTTDAEINALIADVLDSDGGYSAMQRVKDEVVKLTPIKPRAFELMLKDANRTKATRDKRKARPKANAWKFETIDDRADFEDRIEYAQDRIRETNALSPTMFRFGSAYAVADRAAGQVRLIAGKDALNTPLAKMTRWMHYTEKDTRTVTPPDDVVKFMYNDLEFVAELPELLGYVTTPFFAANGDLVDQPGYHAGARVILDLGDLKVPRVSEKPTPPEVTRAVEFLKHEILGDFPLSGMTRAEIMAAKGDVAHAIAHCFAFLLLPAARALIAGPTPGHAFTKPGPGVGASLLVRILALISMGKATAAGALPENEEEIRKTLTSILARGKTITLFDNVGKAVASTALASAMTELSYEARILGRTAMVEVDVRTVWVFTGNNITGTRELLRRFILIPLDADAVNADKRVPDGGWHHADLTGWVEANRPELVHALLTIIQSWVAEGMVRLKPKENQGSFEDWAAVMGGILDNAGIEGFLCGQDAERAKAATDTEDTLQQFLDVLGDYPHADTLFRAGVASKYGTEDTVSLQAILNGKSRCVGGKPVDYGEYAVSTPDPIQINGYGYSDFDGKYKTSGQIGKNMALLARKPHKSGDDVIRFETLWDAGTKSNVYRMHKESVVKAAEVKAAA